MADSTVDPNAGTENDEVVEDQDQVEPDEGGTEETDSKGEKDDDEDEEPWDEARARRKIKSANREAENLRKRLKDLEEFKSKHDEQNQTDAEKVAARIKTAEDALAAKNAEFNSYVIQSEFGLTDSQMKRIHGDSLEELREDAEEFAKENGITKPGTKTPPKSAAQLKGGRTPAETATSLDPGNLSKGIRRY